MNERLNASTGEIVQEAPEADEEKGTALALNRPTRGEIERRQSVAGLLRPVEKPAALLEGQEEVRALVAEVLREGRDYGMIPGTKKKTLFQPGAQRTAAAFGCSPFTEIVEREVDHDRIINWEKKRKRWKNGQFDGWDREAGTSLGIYRYTARCRLVHRGTGVEIGEGWGVCSSLEERYTDRPRDLENTIMRMAKKRALVDAVLTTFAMSEQFHAPDEADQEREELSPEELLKIARGRYFSVLAEEVPDDRIREYGRHAYQKAHSQLPDSTRDWELHNFERAVNEFEKFGIRETLDRAAAWCAKKDPVTAADLDALAEVVESGQLDNPELELVTWLRSAGVSTWIREQTSRLKEAHPGGPGKPAPDEGEGEGEGEAGAEEGAANEPDDDLPF